MIIRILIAATLLVSTAGYADNKYAGRVDDPIISQAYETSLDRFRAPASTNGGATFLKCSDCEPMTVRVDSDTRYVVNGKVVSLVDFRRAISGVRDRSNTNLLVVHHLESDLLTRISVSI